MPNSMGIPDSFKKNPHESEENTQTRHLIRHRPAGREKKEAYRWGKEVSGGVQWRRSLIGVAGRRTVFALLLACLR